MAKNLFNSVELKRPNNNQFDLSHDVKMSMNMGELVPTLVMECVPGDKFNIGCESLLRFQPLVAPVMHRMNVWMHYFFVPNRILWPNWENFITNTKIGGTVPAFPTMELTGATTTRLANYLGIPLSPVGGFASEIINAMPFAAYQKIFNEYYRDQNLVTEVDDALSDGDNDVSLFSTLRRRAWEHDYFTAALPFAQKGDPVSIPLGEIPNDAPVRHRNPPSSGNITLTGSPANIVVQHDTPSGGFSDEMFALTEGMQLDATTINDLRRAFRLQEWLERNALGGTRYTENIWAHFGVRSSDQRLQRPEYIVGTKSPVIISEVLQTGESGTTPQGNMAGHGVAVSSGNRYGYYKCEEHGYIIGIMSVMPRTAYQQGIPKHFLKTHDFTEYYWPSFAHIGEQPIQMRELYAFDISGGDDTFGYTPRYAEYKYMPSRVAGDLTDSLDFWHLGRIFGSTPALNETFVTCEPTHRVFAVTDPEEQKLIAHVMHHIKAVRPMPFFGSPSF